MLCLGIVAWWLYEIKRKQVCSQRAGQHSPPQDAEATVKVHLKTGDPWLDRNLSDLADSYDNYHPTYVLGFNDCGSLANDFIRDAKQHIQNWGSDSTDSGNPFESNDY